MQVCKYYIVRGLVQGVFYRAATQKKARMLGVTGSTKNLDDGTVEVIACGEPGKINELCDWLWQGPRQARVSHVDCHPIDSNQESNFEILF